MSHISIFGKSWIDLVFEGRNKAYGAYQLRQENERTTTVALFIGIGMIAGLTLLLSLLSSFKAAPLLPPDVVDPGTIIVANILPPANDRPKTAVLPPVRREQPNPEVTNKNLVDPRIVRSDENPDNVNTNKDMQPQTPVDAGEGDGPEVKNALPGGGGEGTSVKGGDGEGESTEAKGPVIAALLDRQPQFPGGMDKFYDRVRTKFQSPEIDGRSGQIIRVMVSFVIETDGTLTDIKALNNPGNGLDREAVRVLKTISVKWQPGIYKGKPTRTLYTLPIAVRMP